MGYLRRHAIVVAADQADVQRIHRVVSDAVLNIKDKGDSKPVVWVSPVSPSLMNGECYFFVSPDGSKEGWETSDNGDRARDAVVKALKDPSIYCEWVEVQFGDDNGVDKICRSSDLEGPDAAE